MNAQVSSATRAAPTRITWLGQAGFLVQVGRSVIAIDPFVSSHELRLQEAPTMEIFGESLEFLLATHEHGDHLDVAFLPQLAKHFSSMKVVVPTPLVDAVSRVVPGLEVVGLQPGGEIVASEVTIRAVRAVHAVAPADGYSDGLLPGGAGARFLGYVLQQDNLSIYHSGDTVVSAGLLEELSGIRVDVAILPVNGRDFFRETAGIVGNMDAREAAQLAAAIGAGLLIPMHHDLIRGNTERAGAVADEVATLGLPVHVLNLARFRQFALPWDLSTSRKRT